MTGGDLVVLDIGGTQVRFGHARGLAFKPGSASGSGPGVLEAASLHPGLSKHSSDRLRVADARPTLAGMIAEYVAAQGLKPTFVVLGMPGRLDKARDALSLCNNIPQLEGQGLAAELGERLGCAVILEQDIMLQLLGEWRSGAGQGREALFGVYFGTGIGAAFLQDGDPDRRGGYTLQAGHIPVDNKGTPCVCGNRDCAEAYACGHTLIALARTSGCPLDELFVQRQRPELTDALSEFLRYQSYMVATAITLLEPDAVLLGGGIVDMPGYPREEIVLRIRTHLQRPWPADNLSIGFTRLGVEASLLGGLVHVQRAVDSQA